jgi:membrane protease YdiL (CAAX protease family)
VHSRLHANEETVLSTARTLWLGLLFAGLFGLFSLVAIVVRALARPTGDEPRLNWLRSRYPGLGDEAAYHADPLVPVIGFAAWLVGYLLAGTLVALMPAARTPGGLSVLFQSTAGVMLAWAVIGAFSRVNPAIDAARFLGGSEVGSWRASTASLWSYCALLPLMLPAILISQALGGGEPEGHPVVEMLIDGPEAIQLAALGLAVVVVTPIGEELLFRGFLYRSLRQRLGVGRALLVTASLFAILHMAPTQLIPYTMLGLVFGLVFEWVGSLWASIVLHGLWNAVVFAGIVLVALS